MINKYEERLGTERMLPLVFKMALPAVAAQFVNLLYSMVDRIYIGHIPGIGTDALAGVGVTTSLVILISSFSAIVGGGGAPLAAIALGQGDRSRAGKILGNGFIPNIPEGPYQEKMKPIIRVPEGSYYAAVEGSRGEFGVFLESQGDKMPYRLHYRATGLPLVAAIDTICRGAKIADLIAIGGTLDYVVPDIDR